MHGGVFAWEIATRPSKRPLIGGLAVISKPFEKVRDSYDRLAVEYTQRIAGELAHKPFDRALLDAFAALTATLGPVADLGCGPGHVARYLSERGVAVTGVDLSAAMIAQAQSLHPDIPFRQGSMIRLDERDALGGIVAFYSIIHIDRDLQGAMFSNWRAALVPGGWLLVSFHAGERDRRLDELWGLPVTLDFLFFTPDEIETRLRAAGFTTVERHERDPYPEVEADTRRCYLLARNGDSEEFSAKPAAGIRLDGH